MDKKLHVQIALVGGQPTPVYQGIVHLQPDQIILICSAQSKTIAYNLEVELNSYEEGNVLVYEISDTDITDMYVQAELIEKSLPEDISLSLNLSSGMKLWSVIFDEVYSKNRSDCQRFIIGQGGTFYDLTNKQMLPKVNFDMDVQFRLLGNEIDGCKLLSEYTPEDYSVLNIVKSWGTSRHTHFQFFELTKLFLDEYKSKYSNLLFKKPFASTFKGCILEWHPEDNAFRCQLNGRKEQTLCSPNVTSIVLNTGWFELYVAKMIATKYPASDIRLNCVFKNSSNMTKNEVDIIVNTGNKLIFVECKTQVANSTDVDKFNSVVNNYGGLGSKHLFVTNWAMRPEAKEKCDDFGIATFHFENEEYATHADRIKALSDVLDKLDKDSNI